MAAYTLYTANAVVGHLVGKASIFALPSPYAALFRATAGQSPRGTAVTLGQTTIPASPNGHMYRCTTAGTTAGTAGNPAGEPTWPTTQSGTVTDGTAVWTEMFNDFWTNSASLIAAEASYTGYARPAAPGSAWGTPGAGAVSNANPLGFGQMTGGGAAQVIAAAGLYDANSAGNLLFYEIAASSSGVLIVTTNITPSFAATSLSTSLA